MFRNKQALVSPFANSNAQKTILPLEEANGFQFHPHLSALILCFIRTLGKILRTCALGPLFYNNHPRYERFHVHTAPMQTAPWRDGKVLYFGKIQFRYKSLTTPDIYYYCFVLAGRCWVTSVLPCGINCCSRHGRLGRNLGILKTIKRD